MAILQMTILQYICKMMAIFRWPSYSTSDIASDITSYLRRTRSGARSCRQVRAQELLQVLSAVSLSKHERRPMLDLARRVGLRFEKHLSDVQMFRCSDVNMSICEYVNM